MRKKQQDHGLVAQAVAGTYVVLLGWDITDPAHEQGLLGFAIQRTDRTENETYWLRGMKTFPDATLPLSLGGTASSQDQPFQTFQWSDYSAKPAHDYSYTVTAMYGRPGALVPGATITLEVRTEAEEDGVHSVYFNRGAIASQEYARRFQDKIPSKVGDAAYAWLSRGLLEAIVGFIGKATDQTYGLRVAIYEFQWPAILDALKAAKSRGADVKVIFDAIENAQEDPFGQMKRRSTRQGSPTYAKASPTAKSCTTSSLCFSRITIRLRCWVDRRTTPRTAFLGT
jgi:hypothetical protein